VSVGRDFLVLGDIVTVPIEEPKERIVDDKGKYGRVDDGLPKGG